MDEERIAGIERSIHLLQANYAIVVSSINALRRNPEQDKKDMADLLKISHNWTDDPSMRLCALCLDEVKRDDYDRHMQEDHGYETLNITAPPFKE